MKARPVQSIHKHSQKGLILQYLQSNPNKLVTGTDFMRLFRINIPFVGHSANARLSELTAMGLTEYAGEITGIKKYFMLAKNRKLYKLTEKGKNFKLIR